MTVLDVGAGCVLHQLPAGSAGADRAELREQWISLITREAGRPGATPVCPVDAAGSLAFAPPDTELDDWVLQQDGQVVGSLRLALVAGSDTARIDELLVDQAHRRRGLGRVLHRHALERAARYGRTVLTGTVVQPPAGGSTTGPARGFAEAVGAEPAPGPAGLFQVLPVDPAEPLGPPVVPPAGYRLVTWGSVTPDEWVAGVSALERTLGDGSLEDEDEDAPIDGSYARRFERMRLGRGRRAYHTGVVRESDGRLAGYTSISMTTTHGWHALQGMTVVHRSERGHGLGLVLKRANLQLVRGQEPELSLVETGNDEDNAPVVALNRALGFRAHERRVTWQQRVEPRTDQRKGPA